MKPGELFGWGLLTGALAMLSLYSIIAGLLRRLKGKNTLVGVEILDIPEVTTAQDLATEENSKQLELFENATMEEKAQIVQEELNDFRRTR